MNKENLVVVLKGDNAKSLCPTFMQVVGTNIGEFNIPNPKVELYRDGNEVLLALLPKSGKGCSAIHAHFADAAKVKTGIITLSVTMPDNFCITWRVGQGSKDEHYVTCDGAWVHTAEEIGFYLKEGANFQSRRDRGAVETDRASANKLLTDVKLAMK
jgi:hypothetical protein